MPHPSTCQCGGSGFEKSSTDNPLKIPIPCTPSQKIVEWEKAFRNRFGNYGLYEDQEYMGFTDVLPEVESFIRSLLASHSQALQERHEAEIKRLRETIKCSHEEQAASTFWFISCDCGTLLNRILKAFDSTRRKQLAEEEGGK